MRSVGSHRPQTPFCCNILRVILRVKHLEGKSFIESSYFASDSWFWKVVITSKLIILKGVGKLVGLGRLINILIDPQVPYLSNFITSPYGSQRQGFMCVADFFSSLGQRKCQSFVHPLIVQPMDLFSKLIFTNLNHANGWVLTLNSNGKFTTKSAYLSQALNRAHATSLFGLKEWNKLWNFKIHECHKIIWWQTMSSALHVRQCLSSIFPIQEAYVLYANLNLKLWYTSSSSVSLPESCHWLRLGLYSS